MMRLPKIHELTATNTIIRDTADGKSSIARAGSQAV